MAVRLRFLAVAVLVSSFVAVAPQCPDAQVVEPCSCSGDELTCEGGIGLARLTTVLREGMCGRRIQKFRLASSDIGYLPSNLFYKTSVDNIQISSTNITHFTEAGRSAFYGLENRLQSLSMRGCALADHLQWHMIAELRKLTYLSLSNNRLTKVEKRWFHRPPPQLRSLVLQGNKISHVEAGAFASLDRLVELDLSENRISDLSRDMLPFPGTELVFLRLSYNELRHLPADLFEGMFGLRRVYLDNNLLTTLPFLPWALVWGDLQHLDLLGNELRCQCDMVWVGRLRPPKRLYGTCNGWSDCGGESAENLPHGGSSSSRTMTHPSTECHRYGNIRTGLELKNLIPEHFIAC